MPGRASAVSGFEGRRGAAGGGSRRLRAPGRRHRMPAAGMVLTASVRRLAVAAAIAAVSVCGSDAQSPAASRATFAGVITALSEPNGYFDTDNLISERTELPDGPVRHRSGRAPRRRVHRRRPRPELLVYRRVPAGRRLHRRRPPRQPAAAPAVQGALLAGADPRRISVAALRAAGPAGTRELAEPDHRGDRRVRRSGRRSGRRRRQRAAGTSDVDDRVHSASRSATPIGRRSIAFIAASSKRGSDCASRVTDGARSPTIRRCAICCSRSTAVSVSRTISRPRTGSSSSRTSRRTTASFPWSAISPGPPRWWASAAGCASTTSGCRCSMRRTSSSIYSGRGRSIASWPTCRTSRTAIARWSSGACSVTAAAASRRRSRCPTCSTAPLHGRQSEASGAGQGALPTGRVVVAEEAAPGEAAPLCPSSPEA